MIELEGRPAAADDLAALGLYNYGHFTSMLALSSGVRGFGLHLCRLTADCRALFDADLDPDRVWRLVRSALGKCEPPTVLRVTIFAPDLGLGHPAGEYQPRVLITARPAPASAVAPLRLTTKPYVRDLPLVKSVGLFATMHHRRTAQQQGFDDVLFIGPNGLVTEGATWNVGFVAGDTVLWPDAEVLPGVTMRLVREAAHELAVPSRLMAVGLEDLATMDAAFVTNAAVGVRPITAINEVFYPEQNRIIDVLREAYEGMPAETV